jgi:MFS family permease
LKTLFAVRDFRRLWTSHVVSTFGDAITSLGLLITAQRLTGSTAAVATTAVAIALPQLLFGLVAGVLVDRWDRKKVMVASDLIRAMLVLGFVAVSADNLMWLLYAIAFVQATVGTFDNPARAAVLPQIVGSEGLLAANSFFQSSGIVAGVVGTGIAGLIAGLTDSLATLFVVDALTYTVSALIVIRISLARVIASDEARSWAGGIWRELRSGLSLVVRSRSLRTVMIGAGVVMFGLGAVNVLIVPFIVDVLAVPETWFGALEAAQVTSMVLAGGLVALAARRLRPGLLLSLGLLGVGVVVAGMSVATNVWQMIGFLFAVGWFVTPAQAAISTLVQSEVPSDSLGKVSSTLGTVSTTASVASMALSGLAAELVGIRSVFVIAGAIAVLAAGLSYLAQRTGSHLASNELRV